MVRVISSSVNCSSSWLPALPLGLVKGHIDSNGRDSWESDGRKHVVTPNGRIAVTCAAQHVLTKVVSDIT